MAQQPNRTPTAFQAKQAAAQAAQAEQRYQQDQAIAKQIRDPELKAEVLLDSEVTRSRELARANTVLEQTNSNLVTTPSASTETINSQIAPSLATATPTSDTLLAAYVNQQLEPPIDVPPVTKEEFTKTSPNVGQGPAAGKSQQDPKPSANAAGTTGRDSTIPNQLGNVKFNFMDNEFNQYDRVAYHFKLFMVNDLDAKDPQIGSKILNNQVRNIIVAESGVTVGFNITEVVISDSLSANFRSRSNLTTDISIKLLEPYAMTLPDRLYAASKILGIRNWRLAPMFLQLEFRYIRDDGTIYNPQGSQKLIKLYSLLILDFASQVTEGGAVYDIKCSSQNNLGFRDFFQILPKTQNITLTPSNTVEEFFTTLGKTITDLSLQARQKAGTSRVLPSVVEYRFVIRDQDLQKQEIDWAPTKNQRRTNFKGGTGGEITVARGIGVSALVDDILSSLKNPEFFVADAQAGTFKIPIIECVTEIIGWDTALQDYVRRFTYVIGLKPSPRPVPYKDWAQAFEGNSNRQRARLQVLSQNMKKAYEYLYTGKNTEILNLEIKFNQLHVIVEPVMATVPNPQSTDSDKVDPRQQALRDKQDAEKKIKDLENIEPMGNSTELFAGISSASEQIAKSDAILNSINNNSIIPLDPTSTVAQFVTKNTTAQQQQEIQAAATEIQNIRQNINKQKGKVEFAEDVTRQTQSLKLAFASDPRDMQNTQVRSIAGTTSLSEADSTRPIVSSILTQIYDRVGSQMLEIDMEIRGDTYWLGITDVERAPELENVIRKITQPDIQTATPNTGSSATAAANNQKQTFVQIFDADATILLKFRAGAQPDSQTGFQKLDTESDFFYGIYTIIQVEHDFREGKFTQKLKGNRDTLIDLSVIRAAEKQAASKTQPQTLPGVTPPNLPLQSNNGVTTTQLVNNSESSGKMIASASNNPNTNQITLTPQQSTSLTNATNNSGYISGNSPEAVAARYAQDAPLRQQTQNTEFAGYNGTQAMNLPTTNLIGIDGLGQGNNSRSIYLPQSTTYQRA